MRQLGVRELKASLSDALRSVQAGERIRITLRGSPVADLVPPTSPTAEAEIRQLVAAGRLSESTRPHPDQPPPLVDASVRASSLVLEDREKER